MIFAIILMVAVLIGGIVLFININKKPAAPTGGSGTIHGGGGHVEKEDSFGSKNDLEITDKFHEEK